MKRKDWFLIVLFAVLALIGILMVIVDGAEIRKRDARIENTYAMTAVVVETSAGTDAVTIRDFNGNLWQFKGVEDWTIDDVCACVMDSKGTPEIKDDEIISVRYSGYLSGWNN